MVLINARNKWAEDSHLEPDQKHGFGYLQAVRNELLHVHGAISTNYSALKATSDLKGTQ